MNFALVCGILNN